MKKVLFAAMMALVIGGCGQKNTKPAEAEVVETTQELTLVSIDELVSNPVAYGDQVVKIEGVIDHMCRETGDKMRVKGNGSDLSIEVKLGELAKDFSIEMEGRTVVVEGTLQYVVANKGELGEMAPLHKEGEGKLCDSEKAAAEALKAKGIDPSITSFINITTYEIK